MSLTGFESNNTSRAEQTDSLPYRLFGNLFLEDPSTHLTPEALYRLHTLKPLLRDLEKREETCKAFAFPEAVKKDRFATFCSAATPECESL